MNMGAEREGFRTHSELGQGLAPCKGRNPPDSDSSNTTYPESSIPAFLSIGGYHQLSASRGAAALIDELAYDMQPHCPSPRFAGGTLTRLTR